MEQGVTLGGATDLLAALVAVALPPASTVIAGGVLLSTELTGAGLGAWLGGMVGMNAGNRRIKQFEDTIEAGELLVLADVSPDKRNRGLGMIVVTVVTFDAANVQVQGGAHILSRTLTDLIF